MRRSIKIHPAAGSLQVRPKQLAMRDPAYLYASGSKVPSSHLSSALQVLWIRDVGARIRRQSEEDLRTGVRQGNHIALSVALQAGNAAALVGAFRRKQRHTVHV